MSTRALYTFKGETAADTWNVYKHHDGYPADAADVLKDTLQFAWQLPRYEADEFAAAFCAAGKAYSLLRANEAKTAKDRKLALRFASHGGGCRFMPQGLPSVVAPKHCSDIEFRYEIFKGNADELRVRAYAVSAWEDYHEKLLTDCPLADFAAWVKQSEKAAIMVRS